MNFDKNNVIQFEINCRVPVYLIRFASEMEDWLLGISLRVKVQSLKFTKSLV